MIDFNTFELNCLSKLLWSLKGYTVDNLRYPKAGELVEIGYDMYSKCKLKRVNQPGIDLIGIDNYTYESKVTQFRNKSQAAVRDLIIKNHRQSGDYNGKLADFFIITDIKKGKACCIPSSKLYNIRDNGACVLASADPDPEDFFLTGYDNQYETDYFAEAKKFDYQYLESFR
jgi:hypothetical protein